jgi:hypothetical protein
MTDRKPILCLDFDGVCHSYTSGWQGATVIPDDAVPGLFEFLEQAAPHFDIQVYSTRSETPEGRDAMALWFAEQRRKWRAAGGQGKEIVSITFPASKPSAFIGLDDRVLTFNGTWPQVDFLRAFQPWYRRSEEPMDIFEILDEIENAYPEDIFPPTTQGERDDVAERYPGFIDRTSAMMGRHLAKVIRMKMDTSGGGEMRLQETARQLVDYYDAHGAQQFNRHFGTSDVSSEYFVEFLRGFLREGEAAKPPDVGK